MSSEPVARPAEGGAMAIRASGLSKCFQIYGSPGKRLAQFLLPRLSRAFGKTARNHYREFWALQDISFEVPRGQTVGIIGRNGSGKSTLLQMVCGTLYPTGGSVEVNGRVAALLELGSGFNPEFTGRENVYFNAGVLGQAEERTRERFADIEAFADIGEFIDQPVKTYSSGMLVRLAFAVIAHVDADILVIDEALAVGDAFFTQKCMRFLRDFMREGTILFVSHDTTAVTNLCSHVIWLDKGRMREQGSPKEVCEHYLRAYYDEVQGAAAAPAPQAAPEATPAATTPPTATATPAAPATPALADEAAALGDQRLPFINGSNLRNDLRVYRFDPDARSFGLGGSKLRQVDFRDVSGQPLAWIVGGEDVVLRVVADVFQRLESPIVGFVVKDRLGQALFGENTYLAYQFQPTPCEAGGQLHAEFRFQMPRLPVGEYTVTVAIADGTQEEHVQHQWAFDAVAFRSQASSVSAGLFGVPMHAVRLKATAAPRTATGAHEAAL